MKKLLEKLAAIGIGPKIVVSLATVAVVTTVAAYGISRMDTTQVVTSEQQMEESSMAEDSEPQTEEPQKQNPQQTDEFLGDEFEKLQEKVKGKEKSKGSLFDPINNLLGKKDTEKKAESSVTNNFGTPNNAQGNPPVYVPRYTVEFELGNGNTMEDAVVVENTNISSLNTPNWAEHIFLGWYYDADLTKAVESADKVTKDMTLYASWLEQTPLETLEKVNFASAENVGKEFTIKVLSSDSNMSADEVKAALIAQNLTNPAVTDFINVTAEDNGFVISGVKHSEGMGTSQGFEEGATYTIKLDSDALFFDGYPETAREFNFTTRKEEVLNLKLNSDITYIPASDLVNIINNGQAVSTLNIALYSVRNDGGMSAAELTEGTFDYTNGTLTVGQIVSVYDGLIPTERTLETPKEQLGDIGYVEITGKNGNTYSYKSAEAEEIIFTPDMLPMPVGVDLDDNETTLTVEDKYFDYSADLYFEMDLDSQTTVDVGDFLVFYTGDLTVTAGENAAERQGFAEITAVTQNNDGTTTVTYREATWDEVDSSMDVYTQEEVTADEMLEGINKEEIEAAIEQQALDSGFAEEAAQYLTSLALATENFTKLSENMNLEDYKVQLTDGTPISPEQLSLMDVGIGVTRGDTEVKATVSKSPKHLGNVAGTDADKQGLVINLEVTSVFSIEAADGELEITVSGKFVEEIGFDFGASSDTEWSWYGIIPYISEWTVAANVDLINYTGLEISATMITKEAEDEDEDGDILSTATDISEQIKELLENNTNEKTGDEHHNKLIEKYSEMIQADSDWIKLVEINICEIDKRLPPMLPIIHLEFTTDFVIQMDASVAVGFEFEYLEGERYVFNVRITEGSITSNTVTLQEKTYELCFYTMGRVALKAGVELEFKIGLFDTSIANIGFSAGAGPYTKLYGYFFYELKYTESQGRSQQYSGALLTQVGVYFHLDLSAEALGGKYSAEYSLVDKEWLLWEAGRRDNVLDFNTEQEDMPEIIMRQYVRRIQLPDTIFDMLYLDLITGDDRNAIYNDWNDPSRNGDFRNGANYEITMTNNKFSYNPVNNEILVTVNEDDVRVQGEMIITWKKRPMSFSSKPIQRRITLYWDNLRDGYMIVPYTNGGSYVPMIVKAYEAEVTKPQDPVRMGYIFSGWYCDEALTTPYTFPEKMPNTDTNIYAKWEAATDIPYCVEHYKENLQSGEYELVETEDFIGTTDTYVTPAVKSYEGYITPSAQQLKVEADGSGILRYYYKLHRSTVTFNSGLEGKDNLTYTLKYGARIVAPQMSAKGYTFTGWTADGTNPATPETTMGTVPLVYTGTWQKNPDTEYRVEYYVQQTDGSYKLQHKFTEENYTGTIIRKEDLRAVQIDGVSADEKYTDGTGVAPSNMTVRGIVCEEATVTGDGRLVIKINYARKQSNLTFDLAYDDIEPTVTSVYYQQQIEKPADPTRVGYTFAGWDNLATDEVVAVPILTEMLTEDVTYRALWTPNRYKVRFHKADALAVGTMEEQVLVYDEEQMLTGNTYTKPYYDFAGWSIQEGGNVAYADQETVKNLTAEVDGIVELYAVWTPTIYDIVYHNAEEATHTNPAQYNTETATITLIPAARAGYIFEGWFGNAEYSGNAVTEITKGSNGNVNLYAKWTARTDTPYKAEHYIQQLDGSWILTDTDSYTGTSDTAVTPEVKSYTGFASPGVQTVNVESDGSTVVRYEYTRNSYTLNFHANGGTLAENEPSSITALYEEAITLPKVAARDGYAFAGWYIGEQKFEAAAMPADNLNLEAKWEAGKYTYTVNHRKQNVDGNGFTVETETYTGDMDQVVTPAIKTYEGFTSPAETKTITIGTNAEKNVVTYEYRRNQYTLSWNLNGGDVNAQYTSGSVYYGAPITAPIPMKNGYSYTWDNEVVTTMPASDVSYNAVWMANNYIVSFEPAGGTVESGEVNPKTVAFDAEYGTLATLTKVGHTFNGWYTTAEGGKEITATTTLTLAENHTLYARFTPNTYALTWDLDGGTADNYTNGSVPYGTTIVVPEPVKKGYSYVWDKALVTTMPDADLTYKALWTPNAYTVSFNLAGGSVTNGSADSRSVVYDTPYGELPIVNKAGYTFDGWYTQSGIKVEECTPLSVDANHTLTARYIAITYTINYKFIDTRTHQELENVTNSSNPATYTMDNHEFILTAAEKAGYRFDGWYLGYAGEEFTNPIDTTNSIDFANDTYSGQTFYAKFVPHSYTVEFVTNTGNENLGKPILYFGDTMSLSEYSSFVLKSGYTLLGWTTQADGTTVEYDVNGVIINLTTEDQGTVRLYAVWQLNEYTISYKMGKYSATNTHSNPTTYSIETGADIELAPLQPKSGYAFGGWYDQNGNKVEKIALTSNMNYQLTARWEHGGTFSIKGNGNGTFKITRTIPDGAVGSSTVQRVSVRTLNGTAYGSTFSIEGSEDKYHFVHKSEVLEFGPDDKEKTITVTENDGYLSAYVPASYQIGGQARYYSVEIYKVENTQGGITGTIGTRSATRVMYASAYNVSNLYNSWYTQAVQFKMPTYENRLIISSQNMSFDVEGTGHEIEKYAEALGIDDNWGVRVELTVTPKGVRMPSVNAEFVKKSVYEDSYQVIGIQDTVTISFPDQTVTGTIDKIVHREGDYSSWKPELDGGKTYLVKKEDYIKLDFESSMNSSFNRECNFDSLNVKYKIYDDKGPEVKYVAPIALTNYEKGDEVMLTVIYSEPINSVSGNKTLSLSTRLSEYFESPQYESNYGTGTNAIVFSVKAKKDISVDEAQNINNYLVFTESGVGGTFSSNIGTLSISVKDIKGN